MFKIQNNKLIEYISDDSDKNVVIPEGITRIEESCFRGSDIKSVYIPDSVTEIGVNAFRECNGLESVRLSGSLREVPVCCFLVCTALKTIEIPPSVHTVGASAFSGCASLSTVVLSEGIAVIDDYAFSLCDNLRQISFPHTLITIGDCAFGYCYKMESVNIPASVKEIGIRVFAGLECGISVESENGCYCSVNGTLYDKDKQKLLHWYLRDKNVCLSENIRVIDDSAFFGMKALFELDLPQGVEVIGSHAFSDCENLKQVRLPRTLKSIGKDAFGRTGIRHIVIPARVKETGDKVFSECEKLERVKIQGCGVFKGDIVCSYTFVEDALAMRDKACKHRYGADYPEDIRYPVVLEFFRRTGRQSAFEYIRQNSSDIMKQIIDTENIYNLRIMLSQKEFIGEDRINDYLKLSAQAADKRMYSLLVEFKNKNFGFSGDDFSV